MSGTDLQASLSALAEHEARVQSGPLTRLMRRLGRTAQFAAVYRRVGPVIDPRIERLSAEDRAILSDAVGALHRLLGDLDNPGQ